MSTEMIKVPDIGDADGVEVIEISVSVGDTVDVDAELIVLESDKASMEVPSPQAGVIKEIRVQVGDKVSEGSEILVLETEADSPEPKKSLEPEDSPEPEDTEQPASPESTAKAVPETAATGSQTLSVKVPDIGDANDVEVIEINVAVGDDIAEDDELIVLESDKASMEVPSPHAGKITALHIKVGDKVSEGSLILDVEVQGAVAEASSESTAPAPEPAATQSSPEPTPDTKPAPAAPTTVPAYRSGEIVYAGPAVRMLARDLGVELHKVPPTGPKGRILKEDVEVYVKNLMQKAQSGELSEGGGAAIPAIPEIDFSQFGDIETVEMSRVQKLTAANMHRNWLNVPHVTHFDEADITELEAFRKERRDMAKERNVKLTFLPFLLKACAACLKKYPQFNVSLAPSGEALIQKKYVHIGIAMDTPIGLMVPVIRDVDKKGVWDLAAEITEMGIKAQDKKLRKDDLQGACFTISSLGAIGGMGFTPIVNAPEVAILGVSKTQIKPVYKDGEFAPRSMLPITMSYDHRAINGVDAGNFMTFLTQVLADIRKLIM